MQINIVVRNNIFDLVDELIVEVEDDMTIKGLVQGLQDGGYLAPAKYDVYSSTDETDSLGDARLKDGGTITLREVKPTFIVKKK